MYGFPPGVQSLIIEMMARWKIRLSYGAKKDVGEVQLTNGVIQGDAFSPLLFVWTIDPLINIMKKNVGDRVEVLYYIDDLKASTDNIATAYNPPDRQELLCRCWNGDQQQEVRNPAGC